MANAVKTRGDEMLAAFEAAKADLDRLRLEHYEDGAVRAIVENLGSKLERFFKSAIFPTVATKTTSYVLINRLEEFGVNGDVRGKLHAFRELYNAAKHDPSHTIRLKIASDALDNARVAISSLIDGNIGSTGAPVSKAVSRLLWLSAYDEYCDGVTDMYVSLPLPEDDFATHLDVVYTKIDTWDAMMQDLRATGSLYFGKEHFPAHVFAKFDESGFLDAGIWDGDYRQLIQILSKYEDRSIANRLIPDLRRDHMAAAVLSAIALAGVDVATAAESSMSIDEIETLILDRADKAYAMPSERSWVKAAAGELAGAITELSFETWAQLSGPYWNLWKRKDTGVPALPEGTPRRRFLIDDANRVVVV